MAKSEHRLYSGDELLSLPLSKYKPLIDKILWERDVVILVGKAKTGKSILAQQMAFALSCGEPFLSEFKTHEACVVYVQAEGKLAETRERIDNMLEAISWKAKNFNLLFYPGIVLNHTEGLESLFKLIDSKMTDGMPRPKLVILDPLYMCVWGDLCSQDEASKACRGMRILADRYDCALLLIHHEHRPKRDKETGKWVFEDEEGLFGSFVWQAFPDHIINFYKIDKTHREIICSSQRAEKIVSKVELDFLQPKPLLYEIKGDVAPYIRLIEMNLGDDKALSTEEIASITTLSYNTVRKALTLLKKDNKIERLEEEGYPVRWKLKKGGNKNGI